MKIVYEDKAQLNTVSYADMVVGTVYTDVSDDSDDDLYIYTDMADLVNLRTGYRFNGDDWMKYHMFVPVDATLVVNKK